MRLFKTRLWLKIEPKFSAYIMILFCVINYFYFESICVRVLGYQSPHPSHPSPPPRQKGEEEEEKGRRNSLQNFII